MQHIDCFSFEGHLPYRASERLIRWHQSQSIAINRNQSQSIAIRSSTSATCLSLEGIHRWAFTGPSQATCLSLKGQQEPQVRHTAERHQNAIREGNQSAISGTQRGHHQNEIRVQSGAIKYHQVSLGRRIWGDRPSESAIRRNQVSSGLTWKTDLGDRPTVIAPVPTSPQPSPSESHRRAGRELAAAAR